MKNMGWRFIASHAIIYTLVIVGSFFSKDASPHGVAALLSAPAFLWAVSFRGVLKGHFFASRLVTTTAFSAIAIVVSHAVVYRVAHLETLGETNLPTHDAVYFSIVTFTTLGYGDIQPAAGLRLIAALEALYGYLFLGLLVGLLANTASAAGRASEEHHSDKADHGDGDPDSQ